jgi:hypothetical protein
MPKASLPRQRSLTELQQVITAALVLDGRPGLTPEAQARINDAKVLRGQLQGLALPAGVSDWKTAFPPDFVNLLDDNMRRVSGGTAYDGTSASSLLRGMRNLFHHPEQFPRNVLRTHGLIDDATGVIQPAALFRFYYARFPRLFFDCFQLARHFEPSPSEWNEWALETGLGPVVLVARAGLAEHETNFDPHAAAPHVPSATFQRHRLSCGSDPVEPTRCDPDLDAARRICTWCRCFQPPPQAELGEWRPALILLLGLVSMSCVHPTARATMPLSACKSSTRCNLPAAWCEAVASCKPSSPAVFRLRIPQAQVQLGREYTVKVLEATLDGQGNYRFQNGPFQPSDRRFTIPAGSQLADELVLEYTRGGSIRPSLPRRCRQRPAAAGSMTCRSRTCTCQRT